jgi:bacteriocin-like protein
MQTNKTSQNSTKVTVNNSLIQYEELSELELEAVSGGKRGGGRDGGGREDGGRRGGRTTTVMGIRG